MVAYNTAMQISDPVDRDQAVDQLCNDPSLKFIASSQLCEGTDHDEGGEALFCAKIGACESSCEYCSRNVERGLVEVNGTKNFCNGYSSHFDPYQMGVCMAEMDAHKNSIEESAEVCTIMSCTNVDREQFPMKSCKNPTISIPCAHGQTVHTYKESSWGFIDALGNQQTFSVMDECNIVASTCICFGGWSGSSCENRELNFSSTIEEYQSHKEYHAKNRRDLSLRTPEDIELLSIGSGLSAEKTDFDECNGAWSWFPDSPYDGVTFSMVGEWSDHEYYGMAFQQTPEELIFLYSMNLWPEGYPISATNTVSMGDLIFNFETDGGRFSPVCDVQKETKFWAIHHDPLSDHGTKLPVGVYNNVKLQSVAGQNNGYSSVQAYIDHVGHLFDSPGVHLKFGDVIDRYGSQGLGYLSNQPYNSILKGDLVSDQVTVEYYMLDFDEEVEKFVNMYSQEVYNNLAPMNFLGSNIRVIRVDRDAFPDSEQTVLVSQSQECFNDYMSALIKICEKSTAPTPSLSASTSSYPTRSLSKSPTTTRSTSKSPTSTKTPSKSPSVTRSMSASSSPSSTATRTSSASMTRTQTAAPSFDANIDCHQCLAPANTFVLGDFVGGSDTQGRLFVCGDAKLNHYSVANVLPEDPDRVDLFVKGKLDFMSGYVKGRIVYGSAASNIGTSLTHDTTSSSPLRNPDAVDCATASVTYNLLSETLGNEASTGLVHIERQTLILTRIDVSNPQFFDIDCSILNKVKVIEFDSISDTETVILNFRGSECRLKNMNIMPPNAHEVLYNFPQVGTIDLGGISLEGSVLAPSSHIKGGSGVIVGITVAGSFTGNVQQNKPDCGCLVLPWGLPDLNPSAFDPSVSLVETSDTHLSTHSRHNITTSHENTLFPHVKETISGIKAKLDTWQDSITHYF